MRNLTSIIATLVVLLSGHIVSLASPINANEALSRICSTSSTVSRIKANPNLYSLVHTEKGGFHNAYYIFNGADNYIIASADDAIQPVLGICDNGTFDINNMPPQLEAMLSNYAAAVCSGVNSAIYAPEIIEQYSQWNPIEPMVKTKWGQNEPYYDSCPVYNSQRCVTGCLATALAQIIAYHKFFNGKGSNSYTLSGIGNQTVSFNYAGNSFDFSNMLADYNTGTPTATQKSAVAKLMYACGVACGLNYGVNSTGGDDARVGSAVTKYFGYSTSCLSVLRECYTTSQYEKLLYDELAAGRPVLYKGTGDGGHAFICDGYHSDGLFHINWGWEGKSDGYFALNALNPREQGTGGSPTGAGYNNSQAFTCIIPSKGTYQGGDPQQQLTASGDFRWVSGTKFTTQVWLFYGDNISTSCRMGVRITDTNGNTVRDIPTTSTYTIAGVNKGTTVEYQVDFSGVNLSAGTYYVYPSYSCNNQSWRLLLCSVNNQQRVKMTVASNGNKTFSNDGKSVSPSLKTVAFRPYYTFYSNVPNQFSLDIINNGNGDANTPLTVRFSGPVTKEVNLVQTIIPNGDWMNIKGEIPLDDSGVSLPAGNYTVTVANTEHSPIQITVNNGSYPMPTDRNVLSSVSCRVLAMDAIPLMHYKNEEWYVPVTAYYSNYVNCDFNLKFYRVSDSKMCKAVKLLSASTWDINKPVTMTGDAFTLDLDPGEYDVVYFNGGDRQISDRRRITVGTEINGLVYGFDPSANTATVLRCTDPSRKAFVIPSSVTIASKEYAVTELADGLFKGNVNVTDIDIPSTVVKAGSDVLRFTKGLKNLTIRTSSQIIDNYILKTAGINPECTVYVDASQYNNYRAIFTSPAKVFALATAASLSACKMKVGESSVVTPSVTPSANTNKAFTVTSSNTAVATVTVSGGSITVNGVGKGTATLTVVFEQPGLTATATVTVEDADQPEVPDPVDPQPGERNDYVAPSGSMHSNGKTYVEHIYTIGADSDIDVAYSGANNVYQILPEIIKVHPGQDLTLCLDAHKVGGASSTTVYQDLRYCRAYIFSDWDCDYYFTRDRICGDGSPAANVLANYNSVMEIKHYFIVPVKQPEGLYRLRVIYNNAWEPIPDADSQSLKDGVAYDILIEVAEKEDTSLAIETADPSDAKLFDLYGREVNRENLSPGIYIEQRNGKSSKILLK